ncbi:efflux RND transporter permease subunit [Sinimarinibacterium flocculans]|uniref:Efflux pump membrane transporter n=1 Tax=Sinimarinibacterium flocculans TaxID=985250 RepID=A0A318E7N5_9GAMM|nr:multidrug efflux RND transporter permease subunit [Sinimarinibacterium flocculans]PXV67703.1 HAE1 family hydrophobic/amphiphilic exporter-1/multidrug efflux pump [Sinimarinibacterium flocculans]
MSQFFIGRPIFATVLAIIITIAGAIAATQLPIERYPQITPPSIVVSTSFPGADATTVEQSVAAPIEQQVNGTPNMLYMSSKSGNDGSYSLTVTFDVGTNQDLAAVEVQNRVAIAQRSLPQEVVRQGVTVIKRQPSPLLFIALRATDPRYDDLFLSNYATLNIYDALARIPGVGQVTVFGARDYGMRIWLDPERMARLGVTTQDIAAVLQEQNVVAPAGRIGAEPAPRGQQTQYAVSVRGRLSEVSEYENVVVRARNDGSIVKLRDVARVELAATDYTRSSRLNGEPVANIGIFQSADANALEVAAGVRATMETLAQSFPDGIEYRIPFDTTLFVEESLAEVIKTLFEAGLLVLLVVFLFLESWRATLIPMLTVPVALVGAFSAFVLFGFSINTLTLAALVLAIGLVVDDAIVVVEAVTEKMDSHGLPPKEAARAAMRDVSNPVIAIGLVLSAVFVPVSFLPGLTGEFYRQFALTLSTAVLISVLIALTLTPALCALLLRPTAESHWGGPAGRFFSAFNRGFGRATARYTRTVHSSGRRAASGLAVFGAVVVAVVLLVASRPGGFVPEEDQGYLLSAVTLPPGASIQRTDAVLERFRQITAQMPEIDSTVAISGFSLLSGVASPSTATLFLVLKPWDQRERSAREILADLGRRSAALREANFVLINPASIPGIGSAGGFEFVLQARGGGDLQDLVANARDVIAQARERPELARVFTQFSAETPQIEYVIDRERAKTLGIPISDIFSSLQTFFGGSYINDFNLYGRTYRVTAQAEASARATPEAVNQLYVRSSAGEMVPLSTLVTIRPKTTPDYIERFNVYRSVTVLGSAAPGVSSGDAAAAMEQVGATLPPGYGFEWAGVTYQEKRSAGQTPYIFAAAIIFVFLVLAALYESWAVPFAVLLSIPFGILGAFAALAMRGMANDIYAQVGLVMLVGLAAKNAILIVEFAKLEHERGRPLLDAAVEAARLRLRPILMTSLAFILGAVPMMLATGAGAAARQVLGTVVVWGMFAATLIGIFLVPMFYVLIQGAVERWRPRTADAGARS